MNNKDETLSQTELEYLNKTEFLSGAEISQNEKLSDNKKQELNEFVDSTLFGERPRIIVDEKEKIISLHCTDELWDAIMQMRRENQNVEGFNINIVSIAKFYFQLKSIFEKKGKENE